MKNYLYAAILIILCLTVLPLAAQSETEQNRMSFGNVYVGETVDMVFTTNWDQAATIYSISLEGSRAFSLHDVITLPALLQVGENIILTLRYQPLYQGSHTCYIIVNSDHPISGQFSVYNTGAAWWQDMHSLPYYQDFSHNFANLLPAAWSKIINTTNYQPEVGLDHSLGYPTNDSVRLYTGQGVDAAGYLMLISPRIPDIFEISQMRLKFTAKGSTAQLALILGTIDDAADPEDFVPRDTIYVGGDWTEYELNLVDYADFGRHIAFRMSTGQHNVNIMIYSFLAELIPENDLGTLSISGEYLQPASGEALAWVKVKNYGTEPQSQYRVIIEDNRGHPLGVSPGLVVEPGDSISVPVIWRPQGTGAQVVYANLDKLGDQNPYNNRSGLKRFYISGGLANTVTVGDATVTSRAPVALNHANSIWQGLYYAGEIGRTGSIEAISFFSNFSSVSQNRTYKIFLGETDLEDLSTGMIPSTHLTEVFSANIVYMSNSRWRFSFAQPYQYQGGNLIVMVAPIGPSGTNPHDYQFWGHPASSTRSRIAYGTSTFNHQSPPQSSLLSDSFPLVTFEFSPAADQAQLSLSPPDGSTFPDLVVGGSQARSFRLFNRGTQPLVINTLELESNRAFELFYDVQLPYTLSPGAGINLLVHYIPPNAGEFWGILGVHDNRGRYHHVRNFSGKALSGEIDYLPLVESFDSPNDPFFAANWVQAGSLPLEQDFSRYSSYPASICFNNPSISSVSLKLSSMPLSAEICSTDLRLRFRASSLFPSSIQLGLSSQTDDPQEFELLQSFATGSAWQSYDYILPSGLAAGKSISFRYLGGVSSNPMYLDDIHLDEVYSHDLQMLGFYGNSSPSLGIPSRYTTQIHNFGTLPASGYELRFHTDDGALVGSLAPPPLAAGETRSISWDWTPQTTAAQSIQATIHWLPDEDPSNNSSVAFALNILEDSEMLSAPLPTIRAEMPINYNHKSSYYQCILTREELGDFHGWIQGLRLPYEFNLQVPARQLEIRLSATELPDLASGWIPGSQMSLVFDGLVGPLPAGRDYLEIIFAEPFDFRQGSHLALSIHRPMDNISHGPYKRFLVLQHPSRISRFYSVAEGGISTEYPPSDSGSNLFPGISLLIHSGGTGSLSGTVSDALAQALEGVTVSIDNGVYERLTSADGAFMWQHVISGTHILSCSKFGYYTATQDIEILASQHLELEIVLSPLPEVSLSGRLIASDTGEGLPGADIWLYGYTDFQLQSDSQGYYNIPQIYGDQSYNYRIVKSGYRSMEGVWDLGLGDFSAGEIVVPELAFPALNLIATASAEQVLLSWQLPGENLSSLSEGFETETFPPYGWSRVVNNHGDIMSSGLYPTWSRAAEVNPGTGNVYPPQGSFQAGINWADTPQDEWLISPLVICPPQAHLAFDTYVYRGSSAGDHYYVKISVDDGYTWSVLWDASDLTGGWNHYQERVFIDLATYAGQSIRLAWHALDPPGGDGLWYTWMIDDVYLGNVRKEYSSRGLEGYNIYRLRQGEESTPQAWSFLAGVMQGIQEFADEDWNALGTGLYRWAIEAVYTAEVISEPAFSNVLPLEAEEGMIVGVVRSTNFQPIAGAVVSTGLFSTSTNQSGAYTLILPVGTYTLTASAQGFEEKSVEGMQVVKDQSTTANFILSPGSGADDPASPAVTGITAIYPNPFRESLSVHYSLKEPCQMSLELYNMRGQKIRTLQQTSSPAGYFQIVWDGRDDTGRAVSSGVYFLRLQSPSATLTQKILRIKD